MADLKWPRRLVIVRHGQSEQNVALDLMQDNLEDVLRRQKQIRDADIALTEEGVWQAEETGRELAQGNPFDYCFSSPYQRTLQTAKLITSMFPYPLRVFRDNRLREKEFGRLHGYKTSEIKEHFPEEFEDRERDGKYWYRLPRGENYPDVEMRVHSFLDKLVRDHGGQNILVVTHQVPQKMFRALFQHLSEKEVLALPDIHNCGIQEYRANTTINPEGRMMLAFYNQVAYGAYPGSQHKG